MSFKNYQYVCEYDTNGYIDKQFVEKALHTAWLHTPSKNNLMPYKIHVLGPEFVEEKEELYWLCLSNETKANNNQIISRSDLKDYELNMHIKGHGDYPAIRNIVSAPYVLIFTQRIEDTPNQLQQDRINRGHVFEQMATNGPKKENARKVSYLEIGMFSTNFASICLDNGIDISHTLCFPGDLKDWPKEYFSFLDSHPMLIMTAGKGKRYRCNTDRQKDPKPDFDKIVKITKRHD